MYFQILVLLILVQFLFQQPVGRGGGDSGGDGDGGGDGGGGGGGGDGGMRMR